jgi:hypothetical protein
MSTSSKAHALKDALAGSPLIPLWCHVAGGGSSAPAFGFGAAASSAAASPSGFAFGGGAGGLSFGGGMS